MENLILPCKTPPAPALPRSLFPKQDPASEFWHTKSISLPAKSIDVRLNSLGRSGRLRQAIEELQTLGRTGTKVRSITFTNLLECCITENSLQLGRRLHSLIDMVKDVDTFLETKLVSMYAKCGCLDEAKKVFDEMCQRNIYSWSAMIGAFCRDKRCKEVVNLFFLMMEDGVLPDAFLFPKILQACGNCENLKTGKLLHSLIIRTGLIDSVRVSNSMLAVYAKCGKLDLARRVFDTMVDRDVVTWNSLISGYCQKGQNEEAHKLLDAMKDEGIDPGIVTWNVLISGYIQSGYYDIAMELMKDMDGLNLTPDVFTWTSMISGFAQNGRQLQALDLFSSMLQSGVEPNGVTIASAVSACSSTQRKNKGEEIHSLAAKLGLADNLLVGNSLIDLYSKCGHPESARKIFDSILEKDLYSWNSMIGGYFQSGYCGKAHELFLSMQEKSGFLPNVITWNIMISGYMQNGDKDQAVNLFHQVERDGKVQRNTASWNAIISGYAQNGEKDNALGVFKQMQSCSIPPNWVTILSILPSCANLLAAERVKEIHCCVVRRDLASILSVANSFVDTYAKSGNPKYSKSIFDGIPRKDIISWNSAIAGHVLHGQPEAALDLFDQMKQLKIRPNRGTFVAVINACGLAGMVEEGLNVFSSITRDYQIVPAHEHFAVVVEMYGRAGRIGEALSFIRQMRIEPDSLVWASLLTACRIGKNRSLADIASEKLHELDSDKKEKDRTQILGQSWIETKNKVHTFVSCRSRTDSCPEDLSSLIRVIEGRIRGSKESRESDLWNDDDDEGDVIHSEKLAISFGLISRLGSCLRIVKNRRMCEDCHRFAKYVSSSYGRDIYVSDTKRLHWFRDGKCCCRDYW